MTYVPVNINRIQDCIDAGRIDPTQPITLYHLRRAGLFKHCKDGVKLLAGSANVITPTGMVLAAEAPDRVPPVADTVELSADKKKMIVAVNEKGTKLVFDTPSEEEEEEEEEDEMTDGKDSVDNGSDKGEKDKQSEPRTKPISYFEAKHQRLMQISAERAAMKAQLLRQPIQIEVTRASAAAIRAVEAAGGTVTTVYHGRAALRALLHPEKYNPNLIPAMASPPPRLRYAYPDHEYTDGKIVRPPIAVKPDFSAIKVIQPSKMPKSDADKATAAAAEAAAVAATAEKTKSAEKKEKKAKEAAARREAAIANKQK